MTPQQPRRNRRDGANSGGRTLWFDRKMSEWSEYVNRRLPYFSGRRFLFPQCFLEDEARSEKFKRLIRLCFS